MCTVSRKYIVSMMCVYNMNTIIFYTYTQDSKMMVVLGTYRTRLTKRVRFRFMGSNSMLPVAGAHTAVRNAGARPLSWGSTSNADEIPYFA